MNKFFHESHAKGKTLILAHFLVCVQFVNYIIMRLIHGFGSERARDETRAIPITVSLFISSA